MATMSIPTGRPTVSMQELRRVLAASEAAAATAGPSSPTHTPSSSPPSSADASPRGSPVVTPACGTTLPRAFDVRAAADMCRRMEGYVSFMDVEGLGAPAGVTDDEHTPPVQALRARSMSWSQRLFGTAGRQ